MVLAKLRPVAANPELHHGVPVLEMRVGDPVPTPRAPERYAVRVTPDLARYLLTFNHPDNRRKRDRKIISFASDMGADRWKFTPESIVFSRSGVLQNGQNRLMAVTEFGGPVWIMIDLGWDDDIISVIDRNSARTNGDAMRVTGKSNSSSLASVVNKVWQYDRTVGTTRQWAGLPIPSSAESLSIVESDEELWTAAVNAGQRLYRATDKGGAPAVFAAGYYIIAREHPDDAEKFFDELVEGSGAPRTPTRILRDWFVRRPATATKTGDPREPIELLIRAFNAWLVGKSFAFPKYRGFELSRVRGTKR